MSLFYAELHYSTSTHHLLRFHCAYAETFGNGTDSKIAEDKQNSRTRKKFAHIFLQRENQSNKLDVLLLFWKKNDLSRTGPFCAVVLEIK